MAKRQALRAACPTTAAAFSTRLVFVVRLRKFDTTKVPPSRVMDGSSGRGTREACWKRTTQTQPRWRGVNTLPANSERTHSSIRRGSRPWACLTLLPFGCTSAATTGNRSTERPARRMGDLCRQVSWLTARASLFLPSRWLNVGRQWRRWKKDSPFTVAGAATGSKRFAFYCVADLTVFPLSRLGLAYGTTPSRSYQR